MAIQQVTFDGVNNAQLNNFLQSLSQNHPKPNVNPFMESRQLAGLMGSFLTGFTSGVQGPVVADADAPTDGIEVLLPFAPKVVLLYNKTTNELYVKMNSMSGFQSVKLTGTPTMVFTNNTVKMGTQDDSEEKAFSYHNTEITAGDELHFFAIG